jgi:hypothetical protein
VVEGFAFAPDNHTAVASPETLDKVIENSLGIRLGDAELAHDAYADLREQVVRAPERWRDAQVSVALAPSPDSSMFVATVRWEYRTIPRLPMLRFSCVSDMDEYRELSDDPSSTEAWYFQPVGDLNGASSDAFKLVEVAVDGKQQPARRNSRRGSQSYTVRLDAKLLAAQREVTVAYTFRTLVQQHGHLIHLDLVRPTKGFKAVLSYGDCGPQQSRISQLPALGPTPSVEVAYDGWVFPKGGVAFVWVLDEEMKGTAR